MPLLAPSPQGARDGLKPRDRDDEVLPSLLLVAEQNPELDPHTSCTAQITKVGARAWKPDVLLAPGRADAGMQPPGVAHPDVSLDWEGASDPMSAPPKVFPQPLTSLSLCPLPRAADVPLVSQF